MDRLSLFGLFAVTAMLLCYALEDFSPWFILAFAVACALASAYGFLQGGLALRISRGHLVPRRATALVGKNQLVASAVKNSGLVPKVT